MSKHVTFLAVGIGAASLAAPAQATVVNLVQNPSFEDQVTSSLDANNYCPISSWSGCQGINAYNVAAASTLDPTLGASHFGYLAIGTVGQPGFVTQTIPTVIWQTYQFQFTFSSDGATGNNFQALWNGGSVMTASNTAYNPAWASFGTEDVFSFLTTATSTSTTIAFGGEGNGSSYIGVDDVSVIPAAVYLPTTVLSTGGFGFDITGIVPDQPVYIDPALATGYTYKTGAGDPNFACVTLPGLQPSYDVSFGQGGSTVTDAVAANTQFCFPTGGISEFDVSGIDPGLDPTDPVAFLTDLTFIAPGSFTGTMVPDLAPSNVPGPASLSLFASGLIGVGWLSRKRKRNQDNI